MGGVGRIAMSAARWLRLAVSIGLVLAAYALVPVSLGPRTSDLARAAAVLVLLAGATFVMVCQLRLAVAEQDRRVDGLVLAVVVVTAAFAFAFYAVERQRPGEVVGLETRLDALYFTTSTMLTVGWGDVHPAGQVARLLALVQMAFDVVFVATAAGLLSSRVRRAATHRGRRDS
jgi:voltage-gated potassium channel